MRLIDADALMIEFQRMQDCDPTADNYRGFSSNFLNSGGEPSAEWDCIENEVENAPTIDAIPVEWLENRLNTLCFEAMGAGALYGDRIGELAKSINEVMRLWQKEQEGR